MQLGKEPVTWTAADVVFVKDKLVILEDSTIQNGEFTFAIRDAGIMVVFILSIHLGYLLSLQVIPSLREITGSRG